MPRAGSPPRAAARASGKAPVRTGPGPGSAPHAPAAAGARRAPACPRPPAGTAAGCRARRCQARPGRTHGPGPPPAATSVRRPGGAGRRPSSCRQRCPMQARTAGSAAAAPPAARPRRPGRSRPCRCRARSGRRGGGRPGARPPPDRDAAAPFGQIRKPPCPALRFQHGQQRYWTERRQRHQDGACGQGIQRFEDVLQRFGRRQVAEVEQRGHGDRWSAAHRCTFAARPPRCIDVHQPRARITPPPRRLDLGHGSSAPTGLACAQPHTPAPPMPVQHRPRHIAPLLALVMLPLPALAAQYEGPGTWLDLRYRHERVDQSGFGEDAVADPLRLRVGARSAPWHGWSAVAEADAVLGQDDGRYNDTRNGRRAYHVVADPAGAEINQALLRHAGTRTVATLGRQRINLDNQRFVGGSAWRQNEQTYDGVRLQLAATPRLALDYAWIGGVSTIFGPADSSASTRANPSDSGGDSHMLRAALQLAPSLRLVAYHYRVELEDMAVTAAAPLGTLDSRTSGLRLEGTRGPW